MTADEAKQLNSQTVVLWENDPDDRGTVLEHNYTGFLINWDNGLKGWIDYQDAKKLSICSPQPIK